jgi:surface antigen
MSLLKILLRAKLGGLVFFMATTAIGQNALFLRNSLLAEITPAEMDSLLTAITQTLGHDEVGASTIWENEQKTISSTLTVTDAYEKDSSTCRVLELVSKRGGASSITQYSFCKVDEQWLMDSR